MVKYKIPRGLKKRTSTITCKSIYNPKEKASMDTRDVLQCNINLVDEPNWDKYKQNHKETDVTRVAPFQIEVETSLDDTKKPFAVQVKQLCSTENVVCENVTPNGYITKFTEIIVPLLGKASISSPPSPMSPPPLSPPTGVKGLTPPIGGQSPPPPPSKSFGKPPNAPPSGIKIQGDTGAGELASFKLASVQKEPEKPREKTPEEIVMEEEAQRKAIEKSFQVKALKILGAESKEECDGYSEELADTYNNQAFTIWKEAPSMKFCNIQNNDGSLDLKPCKALRPVVESKTGVKLPYLFNSDSLTSLSKKDCNVTTIDGQLLDEESCVQLNKIIRESDPSQYYGTNVHTKMKTILYGKNKGVHSCIPVHKLYGLGKSISEEKVCKLLDQDTEFKDKLKENGFDFVINEDKGSFQCDTQPIKKEKKDAKS